MMQSNRLFTFHASGLDFFPPTLTSAPLFTSGKWHPLWLDQKLSHNKLVTIKPIPVPWSSLNLQSRMFESIVTRLNRSNSPYALALDFTPFPRHLQLTQYRHATHCIPHFFMFASHYLRNIHPILSDTCSNSTKSSKLNNTFPFFFHSFFQLSISFIKSNTL